MRRAVTIGLIVLFAVCTIVTAMFVENIMTVAMIAFGGGLLIGLVRLQRKKRS